MKKTLSLFLFCTLILPSIIVHAADEGTAGNGKGVNMGTIIFIVAFIIFLIVVRKLYDMRNKSAIKKEEAKKAILKDNIYEPRFWFQCKNCKVTIRKDSMPNSAGCFQAPDHLWTEVAEVGTIKYLCRNCSTLIETRSVPVNENCPDAPVHDWERLG